MDITNIKKEELYKYLIDDFDKNFPFPGAVYIQPTNQCNLRCGMCAVFGRKDFNPDNFQEKYLSFDLFKKTADEVKNYDCVLAPTGGGESFLHPDIFEMIKYAKNKGIKTVFADTNLVLFDKEKINKLIESGIDVISISIDAFNSSAYEKVRKNPNYNKVVDNVNYIIKKKNKNNNPQVYTSFVLQDENRSQRDKFLKYWLNRSDQVIINNKHNQDNGVVEELNYTPPPHICGYPWLAVHILVDGSVSGCSHLSLDGKYVLGNIKDNTILEIWRSEVYKKFRKDLIEKLVKNNAQCEDCNQWMSFSHRLVKKGPVIINETPTTAVYSMPVKNFKNKLLLMLARL